MRDADLEQWEWERVATAVRKAREDGWCTHQTAVEGVPGGVYYPEQVGLPVGHVVCTDGCGTVWPSHEEYVRAGMVRLG